MVTAGSVSRDGDDRIGTGNPPRRRRWWLWSALGTLVLLGGLAVALIVFAGPLLRPLVEARAGLALGRPVSIGSLHIRWGHPVMIEAGEVVIGNPPGFPEEAAPWLARVPGVEVELDAMAWLRGAGLVLPRIVLDRPQVEARGLPDGRTNYLLALGAAGGGAGDAGGSPALEPQIGALVLRDGKAHAAIAALDADFTIGFGTEEAPGGEPRILAEARGRYAGQPITGHFAGGAVLNLRAATQPWPVKLDLANGPTKLHLEGRVQDPLALRGADLRVVAEGSDMARLQKLTGVAFPATPPFRLAGKLDYVEGRIRLSETEGKLGRSDIAGAIDFDYGGARPVVTADLHSRRVDLRDVGGFIGAEPGRATDPGQTREQRRALARAAASPTMLPNEPISLPKLRMADVHLTYSADKIEGRNMPFDGLRTKVDIVDGVVDVKQVAFPIGKGQLGGRFTLEPQEGGGLHLRGDIDLRRVDFSRLVGAAGGSGSGSMGGSGKVEGKGQSLAEILGGGNGSLTVVMVGGTLSALLVDISGLQFGKALLSALGIPDKDRIECLVGEFALRRGTLTARTLLLDTDSAVTTGNGQLTLKTERLAVRFRTESKHFSIGSLHTPILIGGTLKDPSIGPEPAELAARAGAATGLGVLLPPLALLPTIQFGVGENGECEKLQRRGRGGGR